MAEKLRRISFDEFAKNIARFFKLVSHENEAVVVENEEGERVVIQPLPSETPKRKVTEEDYRAFRSAFGGWADVDTDRLKRDAALSPDFLTSNKPSTPISSSRSGQ